MNSIIKNYNLKLSIILIASFVFVLSSSDDTIGEEYKETVNYSYNGTDIKLKFEEQRFIHLSLPADEYIMRLRSKGDFDIYIQPKDKNILIDNLFIRECDTVIITTNTDKALLHSPICISGDIIEKEIKPKKDNDTSKDGKTNEKSIISANNKQNQESYIIGRGNDKAESEDSADKHSKEEKKIFVYYIDTITEQLIEIRGINKSLKEKIKHHSKNQEREGVSICGYYNITNECPYIDVHWVEDRKAFKRVLKDNKLLKHGPWGLW